METSIELILFMIVGAVAIIAAVMMLISENAVHSALFLIVNFACVAFLFLMLNAAFLAMVQITVYAGAIMVLFMFVIMLLGAERAGPDPTPQFPWLTPVAIALMSIFLVVAFVGILRSDVSGSEPEPLDPRLRAINLAPAYEEIELVLTASESGEAFTIGDEPTLIRGASDIVELEAGTYDLSVIAHNDADTSTLTPSLLRYDDPATELNITEAASARLQSGPLPQGELMIEAGQITLHGDDDLSLLVATLPDGSLGILPVAEDHSTVSNNKQARVQVVHALTGAGEIDLANISQFDRAPSVVAQDISFGEVSAVINKREGEFRYGVYEAGLIRETLDGATDDINVADVDRIADFEEKDFAPNTSTLYVVAPPLNPTATSPSLLAFITENRPAFGGPTGIGYLLFTDYMLPFQVIAILLLASMIGAIVLTRDQVPPARKRFPRRLAMTSQPGGDTPTLEAGEPAQD